ncbi:50S ribosomal protein L3 [Candidatus Bipolaricaulota bacterium]|jgi:large subunit ribosomal protein L3|nr:50S ribosomal protein L3 [Candidatus Bipolaricaulota bacterium]TFH11680.1 MAG: 50S ribosomal protein L3 [Candidatus Atribacteria bacterium]
MARGILGRKIGMTQLFVDDRAIGVTVIETAPCTIVQIKTIESDGYNALQLGYGEIKESRVTRPIAGHFSKAGVTPQRHLFEIRIDNPEDYTVGETLSVDLFEEGDKVDIAGTSKGHGFQGVVKRWNFAGGPASHGSHFHRRPGSVGNCVRPGRVIKGKKLPGQMGSRRATVRALQVLRVDPERNLLIVKGSTPGSRGAILELGKRHG